MDFCFHRGKIPKWILSTKTSSFISFSARRNVMRIQCFDSWPDSTNAREVSSWWLLFPLPPPATHFLPVLSVARRASHVVLLLLFFHRSISLLFLPMPCVSKTRAISDAYKNKRCIAYCSFRFSPLNSSQINRVVFYSLSLSAAWHPHYWAARGSSFSSTYLASSSLPLPLSTSNRSLSSSSPSPASSSRSPPRIPALSIASKPGQIHFPFSHSPKPSHVREIQPCIYRNFSRLGFPVTNLLLLRFVSYPKDSEIGSWCNFVGCCLFCRGNGWMSYCSLEISLGFLICDTGL